jgi:hypothetical protein
VKPVAVLPRAERPYEGEALSSWLARIAGPFELRPRQLLHWLQIGAYANRGLQQPKGPIEAALEPVDLLRLAHLARCDPSRLAHTSLAGREWLLTSEGVIAICQSCWQEDLLARRPLYIRADWREAWCTVCTRHRRPLVACVRRSAQGIDNVQTGLSVPAAGGEGSAEVIRRVLLFQSIVRNAIRGHVQSPAVAGLTFSEFLQVLADVTTFVIEKFEWTFRPISIVEWSGRRLAAKHGALFGHRYVRSTVRLRPNVRLRLGDVADPAVRRTAIWITQGLIGTGSSSRGLDLCAVGRSMEKTVLSLASSSAFAWLIERAECWPAQYRLIQWPLLNRVLRQKEDPRAQSDRLSLWRCRAAGARVPARRRTRSLWGAPMR